MSFPRYPSYKDSGVEWIGEVPEHWDVRKLKHNLGLLTEKAGGREFTVALENIEGWTGRFIETETELQGDGVAFEPGDILFGKLRPYLAKAWLSDRIGEAVGDFHVLRPASDIDGHFSQYQIMTAEFISIVDGSTSGAKMPRVSWDFLGAMPLTTPPPPEQVAIANFLDRETAKIDALMAEQRTLIELLKEKRQAVISHAVTKGLNANAPMKDSGVGWLGEVPEHWQMKRLSVLTDLIQTGPFGSALHSGDYVENETPVINPSNIRDGEIYPDSSCTVGPEIVERLSQHKLLAEDIIFGRRGEMGRCARVSDNEAGWLCGTGSLIVRLNRLVVAEFVSIYLATAYVRELLRLESVGSTMDNLNTSILGSIPLPVPPLKEQSTIAAFVGRETARIDALTTEAEQAIALLQERRTALISAAVTGKIDVCGLARQAAEIR